MGADGEKRTLAERIHDALDEHRPYSIGWPGCLCGFVDAGVADVALAHEAVRQHRILVVEDVLRASEPGRRP